MRSILQAAKFLYSKESSARPDEGEKSCRVPSPSATAISLTSRLDILLSQALLPAARHSVSGLSMSVVGREATCAMCTADIARLHVQM